MAVKRKGPSPSAAKTVRPGRRRAAGAKTATRATSTVAAAAWSANQVPDLSIGIARVGDSKDGFFIGPEAPGVAPEGPFRGKDDGIKPQGARFRVFQVDIDANENETVRRDVTGAPDGKSSGPFSSPTEKQQPGRCMTASPRRRPALPRPRFATPASTAASW